MLALGCSGLVTAELCLCPRNSGAHEVLGPVIRAPGAWDEVLGGFTEGLLTFELPARADEVRRFERKQERSENRLDALMLQSALWRRLPSGSSLNPPLVVQSAPGSGAWPPGLLRGGRGRGLDARSVRGDPAAVAEVVRAWACVR